MTSTLLSKLNFPARGENVMFQLTITTPPKGTVPCVPRSWPRSQQTDPRACGGCEPPSA